MYFTKRLVFTILLSFASIINSSQESYPQNYFTKPLDNTLILSGNFGELRSNHFHSGIDIKTQKKEGLAVYSSADGSVSRVKISHGGFGKALYIDHPNGFTTVYGHLKNFSEKIEDYVKKIQYEKKMYEVDLYLNKKDLMVKQNEIIAFSGNTGGSTGPHLHYEIRYSANQKPLNPLLFGLNVDDSKRPEIKSIYLYNNLDFNNYRSINPNKLNLKKVNDSIYITSEAFVENKFGFGVNIFDRQDLANNKNGVYKISSFVDNNLVSSIKFDAFSFEESILINTLIDYKHYSETKEKIIKLFKTKGNKLSIYDKHIYEFIDSNLIKSEYRIKLSDLKNNNIYIIIPLKKLNTNSENKKESIKRYNKEIINNNKYNLKYGEKEVIIPKNTFLKNVDLDIIFLKDTLKLINPYIPVFKNISIKFPNVYSEKGNYLANLDNKQNETFVTSNLDMDGNFYVKTKKLGTFFVKKDTVRPKIKSKNFNNNDWIPEKEYLKFKIFDNDSGIKKYSGEINGKWVLFEYEYKKDELSYKFDKYCDLNTKNEVVIYVEDMVGNKSIYKSIFYRKSNLSQ